MSHDEMAMIEGRHFLHSAEGRAWLRLWCSKTRLVSDAKAILAQVQEAEDAAKAEAYANG